MENSGVTVSSRPEGHAVKKSKFTEERIAYALKQAELGTLVPEVCRKMRISDATFYVYGLFPRANGS
ncbi:transposase [Burkholderia contaminans]|uniref:transposase n=1 Tax=Burkholderia contaminans TaxID=488447 RepID=UPI003F5B6DDC